MDVNWGRLTSGLVDLHCWCTNVPSAVLALGRLRLPKGVWQIAFCFKGHAPQQSPYCLGISCCHITTALWYRIFSSAETKYQYLLENNAALTGLYMSCKIPFSQLWLCLQRAVSLLVDVFSSVFTSEWIIGPVIKSWAKLLPAHSLSLSTLVFCWLGRLPITLPRLLPQRRHRHLPGSVLSVL